MALIKCPECSQDISDSANACVHCGYRIKKKIDYKRIEKNALIILGIVISILIIVICMINISQAFDENAESSEIATESAAGLSETVEDVSKLIVGDD